MTDVAPSEGAVEAADDHGQGRSLARSSALNLVGFGAYGLTSFLLIVVMTRRLGTSGSGVLLEAIAVFNIVTRSAIFGTDLALVRFTSRFLARDRHGEIGLLYRVALRPVVAISLAGGVALFALAAPIGDLLSADSGGHDLAHYLRVLAPFVPVACVYQAVSGGSRGFGTMAPDVVVERLGRSSLLPLTLLVALAAGGSITAIGLSWAGPYVVALVPMALWTSALLRRAERDLVERLRRSGDPRPDPLPRREVSRRFWSFALPRSLAGIFTLVITWVDALMLGALDGSESVGVYTAATRWLIVGNFAGNAVTVAFGPEISRHLAREGPAGAGRLFQSATSWLVLLSWPPYLVAMIFGPFLVRAFGSDFGDGAAVITITGVGFLVAAAAGPIDMLLLMAGRSRLNLINTGVALVTNVGANLLLIPVWGIRGAALAWALSLTVANGVPLVQMWRLHRIQPFGARSARALALTTAVGLALLAGRAMLGASAAGLAVGVAMAGAVVVAGVLLAPDRMGLDDLLGRRAG